MEYEKLGFMCGLEIHQQLDTNKLFCECPSLVNDPSDPDIVVGRRLRALAGETGEVDAAALHEMGKAKKFLYEACSSSSCLVELDEEPPGAVNKDALDAVLQIALLLNAKVVDEIQFMRKTVVDGSNVSGFQRTALIAVDGHIETSLGKIKIDSICLEEEAAKKIEADKEVTKYRLDRLGVPLVEVATDASIKSPDHAKEVASIIGMTLRSTGKVKRGIGSIRQDVNVSIKDGARVEIKGFQDLRSIPKVINGEIARQQKEIRDGKTLNKEVRKAQPDFTTSFLRPMPGAARMYPETDVLPLRIKQETLDVIVLPELLDNKIEKFEKEFKVPYGVAKDLVNIPNFGVLVKKFSGVEPKTIAHIVVDVPKELKSRLQIDSSKLSDKDFEEVLARLEKRRYSKS